MENHAVKNVAIILLQADRFGSRSVQQYYLFFCTNKSVARARGTCKIRCNCTVLRTIRRQFDGKSSTKKNKFREKTEMQRSDRNAKRDGTEREFTTAEHRSLLTPLKNKFCPSRLQQERERARRQKLERAGRMKETQL